MSKLAVRLFIGGVGAALIIASISYSLPQPRLAQVWIDLLMSSGVGAITAAVIDMLVSLTLARPNRWYQRQAIRKLDTIFFNTAIEVINTVVSDTTDDKKFELSRKTLADLESQGSSVDLLHWAIDKSKLLHSDIKLTKEQRHELHKSLSAETRKIDDVLTTYGSGLSDAYMESLMNLSDARYKAQLEYDRSAHSEEEDMAAIKEMLEIIIKFNKNPDRVTRRIRREQFDAILNRVESASPNVTSLDGKR